MPLLLAGAASLLYAFTPVPRLFGGPALVLLSLASIVTAVPVFAAFWAYLLVNLGLYRLGRRLLRLEPFERDRSLGLRPLGRLAFLGFLLFLGVLLPQFLFITYGTVELVTQLVFLIVDVAAFFLSLAGLRRQLLAAKRGHLGWVGDLYTEAIARLRTEPSARRLGRQSSRLSAAAEVERKVLAIQEWPVDEGLLRAVLAVSTSVAAAIIARLILSRFGL